MSIVDTIEEYAAATGGRRTVLLLPGTRHLIDRVSGARSHEPGDSTPDAGVLFVGAAKPGKESAEVEAVADGVGERDVLILLLGSVPSALRVGPLVQSLTTRGLRVVRAEQLESPLAGTLIVACRGETLALTSYLLGEAIPDTARAQLRLANEWAVEGLQLRTLAATVAPIRRAAEQQVEAAEQQVEAAEQQVEAAEQRVEAAEQRVEAAGQRVEAAGQRVEAAGQRVEAAEQRVEAAEQRVEAAEQRVLAAEQAAAEAESELAALRSELAVGAKDNRVLRRQLERGATWKLRRATQMIRQDPVGGTRRLARLVIKRTKR